ncbi:MAG: hypothetical protein DBX49_05205 [Clostridia bacterium]|nr:Crp/Fnr family transcriptional regulator [Bacillota bacterium]PWM15236.1 MAG: hypothetical protein DBX49_05205 [Clostridia bacterium]
MEETLLFQGISQDSVLAMMDCFKPERRSFRKGETILVYSQDLEHLCLLLSGRAHLYCMDSDGDYALLEHYGPGDIFGEVFAMPGYALGYAVEADSDCRVMFIRFACIYGRCPNACPHHSRLTRNLFELSARKAQTLSLRINMISKKSLRRKLFSYFDYMREKSGAASFELELPLSRLAAYLCADRSSMMRELKNMCADGLILREGRRITIIKEE